MSREAQKERYYARRLRKVVEQETGMDPGFQTCLELVIASEPKSREHSSEEHACRMFLMHEDALRKSALERQRFKLTGPQPSGEGTKT